MPFLSIALGEKLHLAPQERIILFKTFTRIGENARNEKGEVDLSAMSAESLNIEPVLFDLTLNFLAPYIKGEKIIGKVEEKSFTRVKTRSEGDSWGGGGIGSGGTIGGGTVGGGSGEVLTQAEIEAYILAKYSKRQMFEMICSVGNLSTFERKCFEQFWYAKGDMVISDQEWIKIRNATNCQEYGLGKTYFLDNKIHTSWYLK